MSVTRLASIAVALLASQAALFMVRPMTSYRLVALGEGSGSVGLVTAVFALGPLLVAVPLSNLLQGRRTSAIAFVGGAAMTAGCLLMSSAQSVVAACVANAVLGLGHIAIMLTLQVLISDESPQSRYDRNFGVFAAGAAGGQLLGPLAATSLLSTEPRLIDGTTTAMVVAAAICGITLLSSLHLVATTPGSLRGTRREGARVTSREVLERSDARAAIYVGLVVLSAIDVLTAYLPVHAERVGLSPLMVGALLSTRAAASLASRLFVGPLVARVSRRGVLWVSCGASALLMAPFPLTNSPTVLFPAMVLLGLALGLGQPLTMAWLASVVRAELRSRALAVRLVGNRLGQFLTPGAAGAVTGLLGTTSVFAMLGALLATSTWVVLRTPDSPQPDPGPT